MKRFGVIGRRETVPITLGERTGHLKASGCRSPRYSSSYNRMKKTVLVLAGLSLFTASCHHQSKPAESPAAYESRVRPTLKREADREGFILTEKGELFKQERSGRSVGLVTVKNDMEKDSVQEQRDRGPAVYHPYTRGKVLNFWPSPDGKHVAYLIQDGLTSCCDAPPVLPSTRIKIMRSDGSSKSLVDTTPRNAPLVRFYGWLSDGKRFVFADQEPDEATQGSPFYIGEVGSSHVKLFDAIDYGGTVTDSTYVVTTAMAEPHFSPKDDLMVYRKGGIRGNEIILSRTDGSQRRTVMTIARGKGSSIEWSADGREISISIGDEKEVRRFNREGQEVF